MATMWQTVEENTLIRAEMTEYGMRLLEISPIYFKRVIRNYVEMSFKNYCSLNDEYFVNRKILIKNEQATPNWKRGR